MEMRTLSASFDSTKNSADSTAAVVYFSSSLGEVASPLNIRIGYFKDEGDHGGLPAVPQAQRPCRAAACTN
jgi:hypothetical protein